MDLVPLEAGSGSGRGAVPLGEYLHIPLLGSWPWGSGSRTNASRSSGLTQTTQTNQNSSVSSFQDLLAVRGVGRDFSLDTSVALGDRDCYTQSISGVGEGVAPKGSSVSGDGNVPVNTQTCSCGGFAFPPGTAVSSWQCGVPGGRIRPFTD